MEELKSAINWFEIPATNFDRAVRFYSEIYAFDMPTRDMGHIRMGFFQHQQGAGIGGAVVAGDGHIPSTNGAKLYLNGGSDLQVVLDRVIAAGGKIVRDKTQISPEVGYSATIDDTEGNRVYLHSMN
ncbi:MAG: VOC family protein [Xanthomonadales bacterium]|nr:VOC family protein [Xanthomonadales bacterium]